MTRIGLARCCHAAITAIAASRTRTRIRSQWHVAESCRLWTCPASFSSSPPNATTKKPASTPISYSRRPPIPRKLPSNARTAELLPHPSTSPTPTTMTMTVPASAYAVPSDDATSNAVVHHMKLLTTEDTPNSKTNNIIYFVVFASSMAFYAYMIATYEPEIQSLIPSDFRCMTVQQVIPMSHDSILIRFLTDMPIARRPPWDEKGIPIPSNVVIKDHTCEIARKYTPVTYTTSYFDVVVKVYEDGSVSKFLHKQLPGDKVYVRGPLMSMPYKANMADEIGMIAGGTGITPMYQLIKRILRDPDEKTRITLLYGSKTEKDMLLRNELEILQSAHPNRFKVHYLIDGVSSSAPNSRALENVTVGHVGEDIIRKHMPSPAKPKSLVLVCGPEGMMKYVAGSKPSQDTQGPIRGLLGQLGYTQNQVFKF
ncbi:hypothetical protein SeMB42_g06216 [Synchytrium endobioticum]|uniref:FAD-binding FR-type domain-containing protein n=1 Tax=Synchytrium endobioticum TaxID=286115 RepID=A0A507CEC6_9FUNG|nr:hypothetical protein SeMB42_g06216 [Synchytrium endobioticum]